MKCQQGLLSLMQVSIVPKFPIRRCDDEVAVASSDKRSTRKIFCKPGDEETHPIKTNTDFILEGKLLDCRAHTMKQDYRNAQEEHKNRERRGCCEMSIMKCSLGES
jgi:hypothetical protein